MSDERRDELTAETGRRIQAAAATVRAPARLRAQVADVRLRSAPRPRRRRRVAIGAAAVAAALILALVLAAALRDPSGDPTVSDLASASLRAPVLAVPATRADGALRFAVDGVAFPGAARAGGWQPAGARLDEIGGRSAGTVTYERAGRRIGYTILAGPALRDPGGGSVTYDGVKAWVRRRDGLVTLSWRRGGRTCVLATRDAGLQQLLEIAARS